LLVAGQVEDDVDFHRSLRLDGKVFWNVRPNLAEIYKFDLRKIAVHVR
jgi:hypothetical protein